MSRDNPLLREENLAALKLYMGGKGEAEVGKELGISRSGAKDRLNKYREAGVLEGSFNRGAEPTCHWDKLEALKEGNEAPAAFVVQTKSAPRPERANKRVELTQLTEEEVRQVRYLLRDKVAAEESSAKIILRSKKSVRNFRVCDTLWEEVTARAKADRVNATHIVEKALKQFLNVEYK